MNWAWSNSCWGDRGHWQPLPVSYLGFAYGVALAWAYEANHAQDIAQAVSLHAFQDPTGVMGHLAYDLGNTYLEPGVLLHNSSVLFYILQETPETIVTYEGLTEEHLQKTLAYLDRLTPTLAGAPLTHPEADLIRREFNWVIAMLSHACRRGIWALRRAAGQEDVTLRHQLVQEAAVLLAEHRHIWLARNRPGGLRDSQAPLERMGRDYRLG